MTIDDWMNLLKVGVGGATGVTLSRYWTVKDKARQNDSDLMRVLQEQNTSLLKANADIFAQNIVIQHQNAEMRIELDALHVTVREINNKLDITTRALQQCEEEKADRERALREMAEAFQHTRHELEGIKAAGGNGWQPGTLVQMPDKEDTAF